MFGFDSDMIFRIPALLIALTIHEFAHAAVAVRLGDPTPRLLGRYTLNPISHLDPLGLIMLWLFQFGWAKPVPVNSGYFHDVRKGMMLVSFAGPGANILLALIVALFLGLMVKIGMLTPVWSKILFLTYSYNLMFAVFNLLPIPPLDGSKIVGSMLPLSQANAFERLERYGPLILIALIYFGVIGAVIRPIQLGISYAIHFIVMLFF